MSLKTTKNHYHTKETSRGASSTFEPHSFFPGERERISPSLLLENSAAVGVPFPPAENKRIAFKPDNWGAYSWTDLLLGRAPARCWKLLFLAGRFALQEMHWLGQVYFRRKTRESSLFRATDASDRAAYPLEMCVSQLAPLIVTADLCLQSATLPVTFIRPIQTSPGTS